MFLLYSLLYRLPCNLPFLGQKSIQCYVQCVRTKSEYDLIVQSFCQSSKKFETKEVFSRQKREENGKFVSSEQSLIFSDFVFNCAIILFTGRKVKEHSDDKSK